jgi:hypothetical protein
MYSICCHIQNLLPGTVLAIGYSTLFILRYNICFCLQYCICSRVQYLLSHTVFAVLSGPVFLIFSICCHIRYLLAMCNICCRVQYLMACTAFFAVIFSLCCHEKYFLSGSVSAGMSSRRGFLDHRVLVHGRLARKDLLLVKQRHMPRTFLTIFCSSFWNLNILLLCFMINNFTAHILLYHRPYSTTRLHFSTLSDL